MQAKITTMTDAQWTALAHYREDWYAIGSATGPTDRDQAQQAIAGLYAAIGKPVPQCLFVASPLSALLLWGLLQEKSLTCRQLRDQLRGQLRVQLRGQLRDQLWGQLEDQLGDQLRGQLRDQLEGQLWDQLWGQLWGQLGDQLWGQLGDQLGDQLRGQLRGQLGQCFWGQHESYWLAFYRWMPTLGIQYTPWQHATLALWIQQAQACGWWWPYEQVCIIADRPNVLHVDAQRRLHAETGPAMAFSDGYALWVWHGVRVSQQVIEQPETLTLAAIRAEANVERQRVMIERWGWERYLEESQAVLRDVDTEPAGVPGLRGLYQCNNGRGGRFHVLICCCASTGKTFSLEVPPDIDTCQQAANWLANTTQLHLLVRT